VPLVVTNDQSQITNLADKANNAPIILQPADKTGVYKIIEDNHVVILRNGERYDVTGKKL